MKEKYGDDMHNGLSPWVMAPLTYYLHHDLNQQLYQHTTSHLYPSHQLENLIQLSENLEKSSEFLRDHKKSRELLKLPRNLRNSQQISRTLEKYREISIILEKSQEFSKEINKFSTNVEKS